MLKYIELAVRLRKNVKDGLHQYRSLCQQSSQFNSLETVIKFYLAAAERQVADARSKADEHAVDAVADLDEEEAPELLLLRAVSGDDAKDRSDREILTPCLKYVWEVYRCALDLLRNNARLDELYQVWAALRGRSGRMVCVCVCVCEQTTMMSLF